MPNPRYKKRAIPESELVPATHIIFDMAPPLPDHFDSPILSALSHGHNLAVSVGDDDQLVVIEVPLDIMAPVVFILSFCLSSTLT